MPGNLAEPKGAGSLGFLYPKVSDSHMPQLAAPSSLCDGECGTTIDEDFAGQRQASSGGQLTNPKRLG